MARQLSLRERALAALGDYSMCADEETIRAKMADIYEKDATEKGFDSFSIGLSRALILRDGSLDALGQKGSPVVEKKTENELKNVETETVESPARHGRGGDRGGRRPKVLPSDARPRSFRVSDSEARLVRDLVRLLRAGHGRKIEKLFDSLV